MAFWSSEKLKDRIPSGELVTPFDEKRITHCAYELGVGDQAFVTSNPSDKTLVAAGTKIAIPPGQFGLLITQESVAVPNDCIAFISIRAGSKFQGLVNVSGFHVDPGYKGKLMFAVYNAGSKNIVVDQGQRLFMIWFADLDQETKNPYDKAGREGITAEDVMKIQGDVASPAELNRKIEIIRSEHDKKIQSIEKEQAVTRWLFAALVLLLIGIAVKDSLDRRKDVVAEGGKSPAVQQALEPSKVEDALPPKNVQEPTIQPASSKATPK